MAEVSTRESTVAHVPPSGQDQSANTSSLTTLLTYKQLSSITQVPERTLKRWVNLKKIPHKRLGRYVRFYWPHIETWLEKQEKR